MSSTTTTTSLQESLQLIANKSGKKIAEVKDAYDVALKTLPPSMKSEKRREATALRIVNRDLAVNTRSSSEAYEGVIVGAKRVRDLMEYSRKIALDAYREDPGKAIADGVVSLSEDGNTVNVLDTRTEVQGKPNKNLGKPRAEHMYMRECIIAARKPGDTEFTAGKIQLWNDQAKLSIPMCKFISFNANGGLNESSGMLELKSSVTTSFNIQEDLPDDEVMSIIDDAFDGNYKTLGELFEFHQSIAGTPAQYESFVVTEGTVQWVNLAQEEGKNHSITVNDTSIPEGGDGVKVWIPAELGHLVNFGKDSIVTIIGYTSLNKKWDSELKQKTDEDVVQINAYSVFGRPGLTTAGFEQGEII